MVTFPLSPLASRSTSRPRTRRERQSPRQERSLVARNNRQRFRFPGHARACWCALFAEIYKGSYGYRTYCVWGVCFVPLTMTTQSMMLCVFNRKGVSCDSERVIRIPCTADSVVYRVSGIMQRSSLIQITLAFINPNLLGPRILELLRAVTFRSPYA